MENVNDQRVSYCTKCGAPLPAGATVCPVCAPRGSTGYSTMVSSPPPTVAPPMSAPPVPVYPQPHNWYPTPSTPAGARGQYPAPHQGPPTFYKNPSLATVLSFFWTGLGQCYNGEIGKGIALIVVRLILFPLSLIPWVDWLLFLPPSIILWGWGMYDAHNGAERINRDLAARGSGMSLPGRVS